MFDYPDKTTLSRGKITNKTKQSNFFGTFIAVKIVFVKRILLYDSSQPVVLLVFSVVLRGIDGADQTFYH